MKTQKRLVADIEQIMEAMCLENDEWGKQNKWRLQNKNIIAFWDVTQRYLLNNYWIFECSASGTSVLRRREQHTYTFSISWRWFGIARSDKLLLIFASTVMLVLRPCETLKMGAENSLETSLKFYHTVWRHIGNDTYLHRNRRENFKSYIGRMCSRWGKQGNGPFFMCKIQCQGRQDCS
jgi:hypothetical protein